MWAASSNPGAGPCLTQPPPDVACETPGLKAGGSGDKQATVELCRVEMQEVVVAFFPPARCKIDTEAAHCPLLGVRADPAQTDIPRRT